MTEQPDSDRITMLAQAINDSALSFDRLQPLHVGVQHAVHCHWDLPAVVSGAQELTYGELETRAERLAHRITGLGIQKGELVGVCMERSPELIVALLALLKVGAAFVPVDPRAPSERQRALVESAQLAFLLVDAPRGDLPGRQLCSAVPPDGEIVSEPRIEMAAPELDSTAYVYFTSGSTGKPKGVVIEHRCAATRLRILLERFPIGPGDRVLFKTPLVFDVAVWEIFGPLLSGATVDVLAPGEEADVDALQEAIAHPQVVSVHFVPSMLAAYLRAAKEEAYPGLRSVWTSGESMPARLLHRFSEHFPPSVEFHNLYGQTESAEVAGWTGRHYGGRTVPLGRQLGVYRLFVLDRNGRLAPPGKVGELCVSGVGGLALGYLNMVDETGARFQPHPYPAAPGELVYRSGDLARMDADGVLHFHGREDNQVKINGRRVEMGDVEAAFESHAEVASCLVLLGKDREGEPELIAYVTGDHLEPDVLAQHAGSLLPDYMVPGAIVVVTAWPLLASGKVDRTKLPLPGDASRLASIRRPPIDAVEESVARAWCEVLGLSRADRQQNFFSCGGTSIRALSFLHRLRVEEGLEIERRAFLEDPTILGVSAVVRSQRAESTGL